MASGAYLAAVTERDHYIAEERREKDKVADKPQDKKMEICHILGRYGIRRDTSDQVIQDLERNLESWARVSRIEGETPARIKKAGLNRQTVHLGL